MLMMMTRMMVIMVITMMAMAIRVSFFQLFYHGLQTLLESKNAIISVLPLLFRYFYHLL